MRTSSTTNILRETYVLNPVKPGKEGFLYRPFTSRFVWRKINQGMMVGGWVGDGYILYLRTAGTEIKEFTKKTQKKY